MKKTIVIFGALILVVLSWQILRFAFAHLPISTPEDEGLVWRECEPTPAILSIAYNTVAISSKCFDHPEVSSDGDEAYKNVKQIGRENFELTINQDVYLTNRMGRLFQYELFLLNKNNWPISILSGRFTAYSPNHRLLDVGGKSAWEFGDGNIATIIYDGQDVRYLYAIDKAFRPYSLNDKLIFIGQKDGKYFVVYDGAKLVPEFDSVYIAYCCEMGALSVVGRQGKYIFLGTRNHRQYVVEVEVLK